MKRQDNMVVSDLLEISKKIAAEHGKSFSWLRFAEYDGLTYRFLPDKSEQWNVLGEVIKEVMKKYPHLKVGYVVDLLSELVNKTNVA